MTRVAGTLTLLLACLGCGRENLDLLETTTSRDSCETFKTEAACEEGAAFGCSFQPNLAGCLSTDPSCAPGACRSGDPFVRRVDKSFLLDGQPFRFAGVSSWGLLLPETCGPQPEDREGWLVSAFDGLVASRSKVARVFAFQSSAGPSGEDFSLFDAAVREARRAGVRLIFMLENASGSCSRGGMREAAWYTGGFRQPEGGYALSYQTFAENLATHYRDEPTVLGYVLMQSTGNPDTEAVVSFVSEMSRRLHGVATSQLISLDLIWGGDVEAYRRLQSLPMVDYVDVDDYQVEAEPTAIDSALLNLLPGLDKPAVIGEGAFQLLDAAPAALDARAERARARMAVWRELGFAGALLWAYQPGWSQISEEFDARGADPLLQPGGVLASAPW